MRRVLLVFGLFGAASWAGVPVCPSALVLRFPCPGCGLTRALWALLRGDLALAQQINPLSPVAWTVALAVGVPNLVRYIATGRTKLGDPWTMRVCLAVCVALALVWAARLFGAFGGPVAV